MIENISYSVRKSRRARGVHLHITAHKGLEIVIPYWHKKIDPLALLKTHESWIMKHLPRFLAPREASLPTQLHLPAIEQAWDIHYETMESSSLQFHVSEKSLHFKGDLSQEPLIFQHLIDFVKKTAYNALIPWLSRLSEQHQLPYGRVTIRGQNSRWGSCSAKKNISLNYQLLFLKRPWVEHILIHELCHTRHLNHSYAFWQLVDRLDPESKQHRKETKRIMNHVPRWVLS